ncbi:RNA polymerase sigma factor [Alkaliphilus transvaalensis]|uniref:RNA polymerase sigma factor n=1 Tax=Alkaliphilus transvaalensis TaxID=114628 RepID=UPI00047E5995|nr:RNA polymerase sigma factor [Alkaliphilus transvaalensis]
MRVDEISKLVDRYGPQIYGFCRRLARTKENADDLYQQTFLRAIEVCEKIDERKNPKGYLMAIVIRQWQNQMSKLGRRERIISSQDNHDDHIDKINNISNNFNIEEEVEKILLYQEIESLIHRLPEKLKVIVIMHYTSSMSIKEIAEVLSIPEGTVKSRIFKARKLLRERLEEGGYEKV